MRIAWVVYHAILIDNLGAADGAAWWIPRVFH
jgi:hypothetical protein